MGQYSPSDHELDFSIFFFFLSACCFVSVSYDKYIDILFPVLFSSIKAIATINTINTINIIGTSKQSTPSKSDSDLSFSFDI